VASTTWTTVGPPKEEIKTFLIGVDMVSCFTRDGVS
jgi:hypothetical protein